MILKEKFNKLIPIEFGGMQEPLLSNCVEISEDFAIGFAEWMKWIRYDNAELYITHSTKELLEIYKKEKEL